MRVINILTQKLNLVGKKCINMVNLSLSQINDVLQQAIEKAPIEELERFKLIQKLLSS